MKSETLWKEDAGCVQFLVKNNELIVNFHLCKEFK